jgi:pimeloyl-ACP methyl ester carboxylesterase
MSQLRRSLRNLFIVIFALLSAGFTFETVMRAGDAQRYPSLGQIYNVDGYNMHLHCVGTGSPTVLFIDGGGSLSYKDASMQERISSTTRACVYDRAGVLWSDERPEPRTSWQLMDELHSLLTVAQIEPPYVLVGASNGGIYARAYAYQYPDEVSGMVFLDARLETMLGQGGSLPATTFAAMGRIGLFRLFPGMICPTGVCDSAYAEEIAVFRGYYNNLATADREFSEGLDGSPEQIALLNERLGKAGVLGDMPIMILHANQFHIPLDQMDAPIRTMMEAYRNHYTALSSNTEYQLINSGHGISIEHPDLVQAAIEDVIRQTSL